MKYQSSSSPSVFQHRSCQQATVFNYNVLSDLVQWIHKRGNLRNHRKIKVKRQNKETKTQEEV